MGPRRGHNTAMAYNLRLPAALDTAARERCQRLGISLNALLCIAVDQYLGGATAAAPNPPGPGQAGPEPAAAGRFLVEPGLPPPEPAAGLPGPEKLSKQQRREFTRLERLARKG